MFTTAQWLAEGRTKKELEWAIRKGRVQRIVHGVHAEGPEPPTHEEVALARMVSADGHASGLVAAKLLDYDSIVVPNAPMPRRRRAAVSSELIEVDGIWCTNGLQTIIDIAPLLDDLAFEQALESGLHRKRFRLDELIDLVPLLTKSRTAGSPRIKRVLALRPSGAAPTESLLETLMVQLARRIPGVPEPTRQVVVHDERGDFVARVDLAWPDEGGFNELDGQQHKGQPVYDANRQTNVVIATGWLPGRFTWREVRWNPVPTGRRLLRFIERAQLMRRNAPGWT